MEQQIKVGITVGDINGIGPELIIRVLREKNINKIFTPVVYGAEEVMEAFAQKMEVEAIKWEVLTAGEEVEEYPTKPGGQYLVSCWEEGKYPLEIGRPTAESGEAAFIALQKATEDLRDGKIDALVTNPINKATIQREDFKFPGHTEYFARQFESRVLMTMVADDLRIALMTGHMPLGRVPHPKVLTKNRIESKLQLFAQSLKQDFGLQKPTIAVLGLNPHAGENGMLGKEDRDMIAPALESLRERGLLVYGPFPADGFFGTHQHRKFDGTMAMYHDQGLIPFKYIAFDRGVNFTAGLPVVRTSPDHGTAYDIAGKGEAEVGSFREAIFVAKDIALKRTRAVQNQLRTTYSEKKSQRPKSANEQAEAKQKAKSAKPKEEKHEESQ